MRLLLDTHVLLWALSSSKRLKATTTELIRNPESIILISVATLWELQIKSSSNKIELPENFSDQIYAYGYELLNITAAHVTKLDSSPYTTATRSIVF